MNNVSNILIKSLIILIMILKTSCCYKAHNIYRSISMPNMNNIYYNITHVNKKIVINKYVITFINDKTRRNIYLRKSEDRTF